MVQRIRKFIASEDAAVTVDWVVLTAAVVGMGLAVISSVGAGATDYANGIGGHLDRSAVTTTY